MSLENLQTHSKLKKYAFTTFFDFFGVIERIFFLKKKGTHIFWSLERVWRFSKLMFFSFFSPNKTLVFLKNDIKQRFLCEFGVSSEILQTLSKLTPNSCVSIFSVFFYFTLYSGKEE